jgi:protein gp37
MWKEPVKWNRAAATLYRDPELGSLTTNDPLVRPRVFCASLGDVFEAWGGRIRDSHGNVMWWRRDKGIVPAGGTSVGMVCGERHARLDDVRHRLFALIDSTPNLDWLLLTKRPENIKPMWPEVPAAMAMVNMVADEILLEPGKYRRNTWLGVSAENQECYDVRFAELAQCRDLLPVLFISAEPLLGPLVLRAWCPSCRALLNGSISRTCGTCHSLTVRPDWVIVGGESGSKARPMHPDWARQVRDQCSAAGVPFFFKQWGEWIGGRFDRRKSKMICQTAELGHPIGRIFWTNPGEPKVHLWDEADHYWTNASARVGKKAAGRLLDGREWSEFPDVSESLRDMTRLPPRSVGSTLKESTNE